MSPKLTGSGIPLFRFCYEHIRWHTFDKSKVVSTIKAYDEYRMINQRNDAGLSVIFDYYVSTEATVLDALMHIDNRLDMPLDVPLGMYGKLAYYLVKLHFLLDYDFSSIRQKMLNNLKSDGKNISFQGLMLEFFEFETDEERDLFESFKNDIKDSIKNSQQDIGVFSYHSTDVDEFWKKANSITPHSHRFISLFDIEKLVDMLFQCSALQLQTFRAGMFSVYRNALSGQFEIDDSKFMEKMIALIDNKKENLPSDFDRIQLLQINYLCENLKMFISRLW